MDTEEILKFQKRARYVASKRGYPELADDFSQEIFIAFARGWHSTVEQLFSSYLRDQHGDTKTLCGLERRLAKNRTVSLDQPINEDEGANDYHDIIGSPEQCSGDIESDRRSSFLFTGRESLLYELSFVEGYSQKEIAVKLGLTPYRISQLIAHIRSEIESAGVREEVWERYLDEPGYSKLLIDWIRL